MDELARVAPDVPLERLAELATLSDALAAAEVRLTKHPVLAYYVLLVLAVRIVRVKYYEQFRLHSV